MTIEPRGSFATPMNKLARMVSLSREFQLGRGVDHESQARKFVYFRDVWESIDRPFAIVRVGDDHGFSNFAGGGRNLLLPRGSVGLYLCQDSHPLAEEDPNQAEIHAANFFGCVIDQVAERAGADDPASETAHLDIRRITLQTFGEVPDEYWSSLGRFFYSFWIIDWGIER